MRQRTKRGRRLLCLLLCAALALGGLPGQLLPAFLAAPAVAATQPVEMANVVVFVKTAASPADMDFAPHWAKIRQAYDKVPGTFDSSLCNYVKTITCGKVTVKNIFPQVKTDGGVETLEVLRVTAGDKTALVAEVVNWLSSDPHAQQVLAAAGKLDNVDAGFVDNLAIVMQDDDLFGDTSSYHLLYAGSESLPSATGRVGVRHINQVTGKSFFSTTSGSPVLDVSWGCPTIIHEFLHTLGLPDLYRYNSPGGTPVGIWDIMAVASPPASYTLGYLRMRQGWLDDSRVQHVTPQNAGTYTLKSVESPDSAGGARLLTIQTDMTQANTETICLEYRKQPDNRAEFDGRIVFDSLLAYRVDNKVPDLTNANSANGTYIYVYRCNATSLHDETTTASWGTIGPNAGQPREYGTTALADDYTKNTLYYSDGKNSGVHIYNVSFNEATDEVTFTVEFSQESTASGWRQLGSTVDTGVNVEPALYTAGDTVYAAYNKGGAMYVRAWDAAGGTWKQQGAALSCAYASVPSLAYCGGRLYLAYSDASYHPVYVTWNGSAWSSPTAIDSSATISGLQLVTDGSAIYAVYQDTAVHVRDLLSSRSLQTAAAANHYSPTGAALLDGQLYLSLSKDGGAVNVCRANMQAGSLETVYTFRSMTAVNLNEMAAAGGRLYALAGSSMQKPVLAVCDGSVWREYPLDTSVNYLSAHLSLIGQAVYVTALDSAAKRSYVWRFTGSGFAECYPGLDGMANELKTAHIGETIYAMVKTTGVGNLTVYYQTVNAEADKPGTPAGPGTPVDPGTPSDAPRTLRLTPPAGYSDATIYVDGVPYTAAKSGGALSVQLPAAGGKTAVMYQYNASGIPTGMYVWQLRWSGDACTATPLPALQDLLSYHGFSVRIQQPAGIRFASGIGVAKRAELLSGGVNGYRLTEYGTLCVPQAMLGSYPLVKGGNKVSCGEAYWTQNGQVNDRVLQVTDGRYWFTSVLIGIPQKNYATDIAFRSYAILQNASGDTMVIYGPIMARSIYTAAKRTLAKGQFKPGSSSYNYLKGIVDSVEGG